MKTESMTYKEWYFKYRPIREEIFESYGSAGEFVQTQDPLRVWTYLSPGEEDIIRNGWHSCDRIGYLITEIPYDPETVIFVHVPDENMG